mgnify:CR=1 FL=1
MTPTADITRALEERYAAPEWASFRELANATGARAACRIDFYAQNLYPSKRLVSVAVEVKVSRSDFMRELERPQKRAPWEQLAAECWFATPSGLVKPDEVPEGWGLVELQSNGRLRRKKLPTQRIIKSQPLTFVAALARRCADEAHDPVAWKLMGRTIRYRDLLRLGQKAVAVDTERRLRQQAKRIAHLEEQVSPAQRKWRQRAARIWEIVGRETGHHALTIEQFEQWVRQAKHPRLDPRQARLLIATRDHLNRILSESEQGGAG